MKPYCTEHRKASELPPSEMTRAQKFETPFSQDWEQVFDSRLAGSASRQQDRQKRYLHATRPLPTPETDMQALMEAPPGEPVPKSVQAGHSDHERIVDAIDRLSDRHRWIFDAMVREGRSLRSVAAELALSKTHIARLRDEALTELQTELKDMVNE